MFSVCTLSVCVILWTLFNLVPSNQVSVTVRRDNAIITVTFSQTDFNRFYELLCEGSYRAVSAHYNVSRIVKLVEGYQARGFDDTVCKYYMCWVYHLSDILSCTLDDFSYCYSSERVETIQYSGTTCSPTKWVSFCWGNNGIMNYSHLSRDIKKCEDKCECATKAKLTSRSTSRQTAIRTVVPVSDIWRTDTTNMQATATVTVFVNASLSNDQEVSHAILSIYGVVAAVTTLLVVSVIVVLVCRRKRSVQKIPSNVYEKTSSVALPLTAIRTSPFDRQQEYQMENAHRLLDITDKRQNSESFLASGSNNYSEVECNVVEIKHYQNVGSDTPKNTDLYAKLGEDTRNVVNPYDILLPYTPVQNSGHAGSIQAKV